VSGMLVFVFAVFLVAHGLIHLLWFVPAPDDPKWPFSLARSPVLKSLPQSVLRPLAMVDVAIILIAFAVAALGLFGVPALAPSWGIAATVGAIISIEMCVVFWDRQLVWGPLIDVAIIVAAVLGWPKAW
jgi:hypothetical protein